MVAPSSPLRWWWWWWWCPHCHCCRRWGGGKGGGGGGAAAASPAAAVTAVKVVVVLLRPLPPLEWCWCWCWHPAAAVAAIGVVVVVPPAAVVAAAVMVVVVVVVVVVCGLAHLLTWHPCCHSLCSLPPPFLSLLTPIPPCNTLVGCLGVLCSRLVLVQPGKCQHSYLAEFQTPTFFDRDFNFNCSTFSRAPKTMKIIIYILYIDGNAYKKLI
jgi:hypothetical protein